MKSLHLLSNIIFSILFCSVGVVSGVIEFIFQSRVLYDELFHVSTEIFILGVQLIDDMIVLSTLKLRIESLVC